MSIPSNDIRDSGIRKAAIFVASLDQSAADLLLDQLPPDCADRVRQAAISIDRIDPEERRRVIDEFRRIGMMIPDASPPGIDLDGPAANRLGASASQVPEVESAEQDSLSAAAQAEAEDASSDAQPFAFLHNAEEEKLAELLEGERPQTVAMVLSQLPPQRAGDVLARLPSPLQVDAVRRLVDLEHTDADTLREIEQAMEARLTRQFAAEPGRRSGPDMVARILAACSGRVAGGILDNLAEYDQTLAERLGHKTIKFDDLIQLDEAALSAVVEAVEPEVGPSGSAGCAAVADRADLAGHAPGRRAAVEPQAELSGTDPPERRGRGAAADGGIGASHDSRQSHPNRTGRVAMATILRMADASHGSHAVAMNFDDLAAQAGRFVTEAKAEAAEIVTEAKQQAEAIRQKAAEEGAHAAVLAVEQMVAEQLSPALAGLRQVASDLQHARQEWLSHWESRRRTFGFGHGGADRSQRIAAAAGDYADPGARGVGIGGRQPGHPTAPESGRPQDAGEPGIGADQRDVGHRQCRDRSGCGDQSGRLPCGDPLRHDRSAVRVATEAD